MTGYARCLPPVAYTHVVKPSHLYIEAFACQGGAAEVCYAYSCVTNMCVRVCVCVTVCVCLDAVALTMPDRTRRSAQRST